MLKKLTIILLLILPIILISCTTNQPVNNTPNTIKECSSDLECMKSGCSGQLCISKTNANDNGFTTCEFKPEYECYNAVTCSCVNNKCSWSDNEKLAKCMQEKSKINA